VSKSLTKIRVVFADETEREVVVGAFAQIAAKRRYGMDALRDQDPEPVLYGVWIELDGPRPKNEDPDLFDEWLKKIDGFELVQPDDGEAADDEDPTPAEPSGSSLVSPPTSE
jgi:hypothetical protein